MASSPTSSCPTPFSDLPASTPAQPTDAERPPPEPPPDEDLNDLTTVDEQTSSKLWALRQLRAIRQLPRTQPRGGRRYSVAPTKYRRDLVHEDSLVNKLNRLPVGSLMDGSRIISPTSIRDFEFFPTPPRLEAGDGDVAPLFGSSDIDDVENVVHVVYHPRTVGIGQDKYRVFKLDDGRGRGGLSDSGANICITNDSSILLNVRHITPFRIGIAVDTSSTHIDVLTCKLCGDLPMEMADGSIHLQPCYYNEGASDTIISPQAVCKDSPVFTRWSQEGWSDGRPGTLSFYGDTSPSPLMRITLEHRNGLYYCCEDVLVSANHTPITSRPAQPILAGAKRSSIADQYLTAELWASRLGHCSEKQLSMLPGNVHGVPSSFECHPFRYIDWKEAAKISRQAASRLAQRATTCGQRFLFDFGFIRSSTDDYKPPGSTADRIITSFDGYNCYLAIIDEASRFCWIFLCKSKEPPIEIASDFLKMHGLPDGGQIRTDQGGELARSEKFRTTMLRDFKYVVEPTGADSPSQNGMVERLNGTLGTMVRSLLYGSGLPARYWSAALLHAAYLYNRRVHSAIDKTPYEAWHGRKPDLHHLKLFGSRVAVRRTGQRHSKLDRHDFRGIFIGYTGTDKNIRYLDLDSGIIKSSHHAVFDEAWFTHSSRPPAAQLLYDIGILSDSDVLGDPIRDDVILPLAAYPPFPLLKSAPSTPPSARLSHLPLGLGPRTFAASAAKSEALPAPLLEESPATVLAEFNITIGDVAQVYFSPKPFNEAFEEEIELWPATAVQHPTAGLSLLPRDGRVYLAQISPSTPGAKIPRWRSRLRGACLLQVGQHIVHTVQDVKNAFAALSDAGSKSCTLLFAHSDIRDGLTNTGIPHVSLDQLNRRHLLQLDDFDIPSETLSKPVSQVVDEGGVVNCITRVLRLTRGKLLREPDWSDWQQSEWLQLDQYMKQNMFGQPVQRTSSMPVFHLVWSYAVKAVDNRKKARCTCDGSTRSGQVRVLDHTYANGLDQTGSRIFYAAAAAENLVIYGADVSNAFGEADPPKQGFFIYPDQAFREWWTEHLGNPPIPDGHVIPVLRAMQGHPESPRLWEKHIDKILRDIGLTPTVHEPCLYSGVINGDRVLFKRQVDDFACAAPSATTCQILFDLIDDHLLLPLKPLGLVTMFNGLDILQTRDYIKISCESYIDKICEKYLSTWMRRMHIKAIRPTPLPTGDSFMKMFLTAVGDPDDKAQSALASEHGLSFRAGIGELIYAMVSCRPDISYGVVKASQSSACPASTHYEAVKHMLRYLYATKSDGIYFWRATPNNSLQSVPPPTLRSSNMEDLILDGRPECDPTRVEGYADSDWAACLKTRRSMGGLCLRMAGGSIAWKSRLMPTVALSSTEAEFMAACDAAKVILFVRSILWDLGIPQLAATLLYEDNDACTAMANANKPTSRTRHMDIRHFALTEWVERDLVALERVHTSINLADHFSKQLQSTLFSRHVDWILGHVPPKYSPRYDLLFGHTLYPPQQTPSETESPTHNTHSVSLIFSDINTTHGFKNTTHHDQDIDPVLSCTKKLIASWSSVTRYRVSSSTLAFFSGGSNCGGVSGEVP